MARPKKDTELCAERRILDAFWHVLESTPLRCVSVRTVAQTAEVNRGTFYYHFKSVDALVDRAIESELLERHSIVHEVLLMTTCEIDRMPLDSMQRHIERTVLLVRQGGGEHGGARCGRARAEVGVCYPAWIKAPMNCAGRRRDGFCRWVRWVLRAGSIDSRAGVDASRGRFNRFRSRIST